MQNNRIKVINGFLNRVTNENDRALLCQGGLTYAICHRFEDMKKNDAMLNQMTSEDFFDRTKSECFRLVALLQEKNEDPFFLSGLLMAEELATGTKPEASQDQDEEQKASKEIVVRLRQQVPSFFEKLAERYILVSPLKDKSSLIELVAGDVQSMGGSPASAFIEKMTKKAAPRTFEFLPNPPKRPQSNAAPQPAAAVPTPGDR